MLSHRETNAVSRYGLVVVRGIRTIKAIKETLNISCLSILVIIRNSDAGSFA